MDNEILIEKVLKSSKTCSVSRCLDGAVFIKCAWNENFTTDMHIPQGCARFDEALELCKAKNFDEAVKEFCR